MYTKSGFLLEESIREPKGQKEVTIYLQSKKIARIKDFMLKEGIKSIIINSEYGFEEKSLHFLSEWTFIESIEIQTPLLDLTGLNNLTELESIFISGKIKQELDFQNFPNLKFLNIIFSEKTKNINCCVNLEVIYLWNFPFNDFTFFIPLINIRELQLFDSRTENLEGIESLCNLRKVNLERLKSLDSIENLRECPKITHMTIRGCKRLFDYSPISSLYELEELYIVDSGSSRILDFLPQSGNLSYGYININIVNGDVEKLLAYPIIFKNYRHFSHKNIHKLLPQQDGSTKLVTISRRKV